MTRTMTTRAFALLAILVTTSVAVWPSAARATPADYTGLYVFGDSLSDVGNVLGISGDTVPPPQTYYQGRFSNGSIWADRLSQKMGLGPLKPSGIVAPAFTPGTDTAVSFAIGGTTTDPSTTIPANIDLPGLVGQVGLFNTFFGGSADSGALYAIWSGSNDYLGAAPADLGPAVANASANFQTAVNSLYGAGAREFLVLNLPDLGQTPLVAEAGPLAQAALNNITAAHNAQLALDVTGLSASLADSTFYTVDVNALIGGLTFSLDAGPAAGCLFENPFTAGVCNSVLHLSAPSIFWDELHPTTDTHRQIFYAAKLAAGIPEPGTLIVFAFGLAVLGASAACRRNAS